MNAKMGLKMSLVGTGSPPRQPDRPGAHLLLTGVTGFLGKAILEALLRRREELGIKRVYLLIRPGEDRTAKRRFAEEVAGSSCFEHLPEGWTGCCEVLCGDLNEPGCGLDPATLDRLHHDLTHIVNCAASVKFDLPLREATRANIESALEVLALARRCTGLRQMVNLSTAYVTPFPGEGRAIEERLVPLFRPARELYADIRSGRVSEADLLGATGHPNTYTLTKCIAEHLLAEEHGSVPLSIIRPSIISVSWRHPEPGWVDTASGFTAWALLVGIGGLRAFCGDLTTGEDIVPCDVVAARVLQAVFEASPPRHQPRIWHVTAGASQCCRNDEVSRIVPRFFSTHPAGRPPDLRFFGTRDQGFALADLCHRALPVQLARAWFFLMRRPKDRRRLDRLNEALASACRGFAYFASHTFDFYSSVPLKEPGFTPRAYLELICRGIYRHLLRRDETEIAVAGRAEDDRAGSMGWLRRRPLDNRAVRAACLAVRWAARRLSERVTFDLPSFREAVTEAPAGCTFVIAPNHHSFMDFVICSYLFYTRPDLGVPVPHIAAVEEFSRVALLGRLFRRLQAFYIPRGLGGEHRQTSEQVRRLVAEGRSIMFFPEGMRSRSRRPLPPRRGLLRALQGSGRPCTVLPLAVTYDHVPEERAFERELCGEPRPEMTLAGFLRWTRRMLGGEVDLGRVHLSCGAPLLLDRKSDVHALSRRIVLEQGRALATTTHHLRCFLEHSPVEGTDEHWLREAVVRRGVRVLHSARQGEAEVSRCVELCMRRHWARAFLPEARRLFPGHPVVEHYLDPGHRPTGPKVSMAPDDPRVPRLLRALLAPACRDFSLAASELGTPGGPLLAGSPKELLQRRPGAYLPHLEAAFFALQARGVLRMDHEGRWEWGPQAAGLAAFRAACKMPAPVWPGRAQPASRPRPYADRPAPHLSDAAQQ